jgi:LmbE family N-acetylglucosaminyl deacetylase
MKSFVNDFDVVVLSPHLDDAALSCGQHIWQWKQEGKKIMIITLFMKHTGYKYLPNYTKSYLKTSGFKTGDDFGAARILEDVGAMKSFGVQWEHWGLLDAGFRIYKNKKAKYPTKKSLLSAKIKNEDKKLIETISNKLEKINSKLFLIPFDIGAHVDHLIVKKAGEKIKGNKLYYLESPYLWQENNFLTVLKMLKKIKSFKFGKKEKNQILKEYTSQYHLQVNKYFIYPEILVSEGN